MRTEKDTGVHIPAVLNHLGILPWQKTEIIKFIGYDEGVLVLQLMLQASK